MERSRKKGMPLPDVCILSPVRCAIQKKMQATWTKLLDRAASCCSFAGNSKPAVPEDAGIQTGALPMGVLVLFNSPEQLQSTQLTTTWAWKCLMIADKIRHPVRIKVITEYNRTHVQWQSTTCKFHNRF